MSVKDKLVAEVVARVVGSFTKGNSPLKSPKRVPRWAKTPVGKLAIKRYGITMHEVESFDGLKLNAIRFRSRKGCYWKKKNHVVVLVHGFRGQQTMMWQELPIFLPLGYDVVTLDLRASGLSEGKKNYTMGYDEAKDVGAVCQWIREEYGGDVVLGLVGQSAGAATVLLYAPEDPNLAFVIEECGYCGMVDTLHELRDRQLKFVNWDEFLPRVLKHGAVGDVTYDDVQPISAVAELDPDIPLLVQHSIPDTFIVVDNADRLYEAKRGKKEMFKYAKGDHAQAFYKQPVQFRNDIVSFMKKNDLLKRKVF